MHGEPFFRAAKVAAEGFFFSPFVHTCKSNKHVCVNILPQRSRVVFFQVGWLDVPRTREPPVHIALIKSSLV